MGLCLYTVSCCYHSIWPLEHTVLYLICVLNVRMLCLQFWVDDLNWLMCTQAKGQSRKKKPNTNTHKKKSVCLWFDTQRHETDFVSVSIIKELWLRWAESRTPPANCHFHQLKLRKHPASKLTAEREDHTKLPVNEHTHKLTIQRLRLWSDTDKAALCLQLPGDMARLKFLQGLWTAASLLFLLLVVSFCFCSNLGSSTSSGIGKQDFLHNSGWWSNTKSADF